MSEETKIAFLSVEKTVSGDGYIGGLLVTDSRGVPLDFLCTHSVKPSDTQKHLYGATLKPHISVFLCGKNLLAKMKEQVSVVLVKDTAMLDVRPFCNFPVVSIRQPDVPDQVYTDVARYKMEATKGDLSVIETGCNKKYLDDWKAAEPILQEFSQSVDLLEPFQRIAIALQALGKRDEKNFA